MILCRNYDPTAIIYIFSYRVYIFYCLTPPYLPRPTPSWKHVSQGHGIEVLCVRQFNNKRLLRAYPVLVLISLISHLDELDEPVFSMLLILVLSTENYLNVRQNWPCRKHS